MSFGKTNAEYEKWLGKHTPIVERDLEKKHERMAESPFRFLRATFFRWAGQIPDVCAALKIKKMPIVLSVGDIHCENYGTWRDEEGRLVWGVNDFDEAADIPYAFDLVRLATSISLAEKVKIDNKVVARVLLEGYREGLGDPRPTLPFELEPIVAEKNKKTLRDYVVPTQQDRQDFLDDTAKLKPANPPPEVVDLLRESLPKDAHVERFARRSAGGGSLGRARFVVIASWHGGEIVREAKALVPSAWNWAQDNAGAPPRFLDLAAGRYRAPDPFLTVKQSFVVRRLAPDSRKLALGDIHETDIKDDLIRAMGRDLGAIHAADGESARIPDHLAKLGKDATWLFDAAQAAEQVVLKDFGKWQEEMKAKPS